MVDCIFADNPCGWLLFEVEILGAFSSACSILHDFLLVIHRLNELGSVWMCLGIHSFVQVTFVQVFAQFFALSIIVSVDGVSCSRFALKGNVASHLLFVLVVLVNSLIIKREIYGIYNTIDYCIPILFW